MNTFRAAYIPSDPTSNGVGLRLTGPEDSHLPDADLRRIAESEATNVDAHGEILIGDWTE